MQLEYTATNIWHIAVLMHTVEFFTRFGVEGLGMLVFTQSQSEIQQTTGMLSLKASSVECHDLSGTHATASTPWSYAACST